ncbi:MAG TPA: hypothetical protein VLV83_23820 [Acidobacteriota bacterium]|nr:hypothetical protein [Acidobacteriota bacterium]
MPPALTAAVRARIQQAVDNGEHLPVADAFELSFSDSSVHTFSQFEIPSSLSPDGRSYSAGVFRDTPETYPRPVGPSDDDVEITFDNSAGYFTALADAGVNLSRPQLKVVRVITDMSPPDNAIGVFSGGEAYWKGWGGKPRWDRDKISWSFSPSPLSLNHRAGWLRGRTCQTYLGDGFWCPYDFFAGFGRLNPLLDSGTFVVRTIDSFSTTPPRITDAATDFTALGVQVGHGLHIYNEAAGKEMVIGKVSQIVDANTLEVEAWLFQSGTPAAGWEYEVGPVFAQGDCDGLMPSCIRRGMFGPAGIMAEHRLNNVRNRYMLADLPPSPGKQYKAIRPQTGRLEVFEPGWQGNKELIGEPHQVVFGRFALRDLPPEAWYTEDKGTFAHALYVPSLGRCNRMTHMEVGGNPPDDINLKGDNPTPLPQGDDSIILIGWNEESGNGGDDADQVPGLHSEAQRIRSVGALDAYPKNFASRNPSLYTAIKTYKHTPWVFNNSSGTGISAAGKSLIRARFEPPDGFDVNQLQASIHMEGILAQRLSDGVTDWQLSIAEAGWLFCTTGIWGAWLDDTEDVDQTSFTELDTYHRGSITDPMTRPGGGPGGADPNLPSDDPGQPTDDGDLDENPQADPEALVGKGSYTPDHVFIRGLYVGRAFIGATLEITEVGREGSATIIDVRRVSSLPPVVLDPRIGGYHGVRVKAADQGKKGTIFYLDQALANAPQTGDSFQISFPATLPRFMANGVVRFEDEAAKQLEQILLNGGATFWQDGGVIRAVWSQAVNLTAVDSGTTLTDYGASRNCAGPPGEPAAQFEENDAEGVETRVNVEFPNQVTGYSTDSIPFVLQHVEAALNKAFPALKRAERKPKNLRLSLTTDVGAAARLAKKRLAEHGAVQLAGGQLVLPGKIRLTMSWPDFILLTDQDGRMPTPRRSVFKLDLENLPSYLEYGRLEKFEEDNASMTVSMELSPHFNSEYDDGAADATRAFWPNDVGDEIPPSCRIDEITEELRVADDGSTVSDLLIKYTLPEEGEA